MRHAHQKKQQKHLINKGQLTVLTLALSGALAAMMPMPGQAQSTTISTSSPAIAWGSDDLIVGASGTISATNASAVNATGTLGTLSNSGTILGGGALSAGINNNGGTISALLNNSGGAITGIGVGISNAGLIETLTNNGTIYGDYLSNSGTVTTVSGIYNSGTINTLSNSISGSIVGYNGVYNSGSISSLENNGAILGYYAVNLDHGTISTLTNNGTINGYLDPSYLGNMGIRIDQGSIGTLNNNNLISGFYQGIYSDHGSIGALTNNSGGTILGVFTAVYVDGGTIGTLTNSGLIRGGNNGVYVDLSSNSALPLNGSVGALINSGTIVGSSNGVFNSGSIGSLGNTGTISSSMTGFGIQNVGSIGTLNNGALISGGSGIYNNGGTISRLLNSGTISGIVGIDNFNGTIGALSNSRYISGSVGVLNSGGTISTLTNSGTISSSATFTSISTSTISSTVFSGGIVNTGSIGTLSNSNFINSSASIDNSGSGTIVTGGIVNTGLISTLSNSGIVSTSGSISGTNAGYYFSAGIYNTGTIGTLNNLSGGTISSRDAYGTTGTVGIAIQNQGAIGVLSNSGLISGANTALSLDQGSTLASLINAGTIAGNISNFSGTALTIYGGSGNSFGTLTGYSGGIGTIDVGNIYTNTSLFFGSGNQLLNDNISFVSIAGTVANAGTLQVNNPLTITGNYNQSAAGSLIFGVTNPVFNGNLTDTGYGRLVVSGNATVASGSSISLKSLGYSFAQGQRYVVLAAGGTLTASGVIYSATGYSVTGTIQTDSNSSSYTDLVLTLGGATGNNAVNNATNANATSALSGLFRYAGTDAALLALFNPATTLDKDASNKAGEQLNPAAVHGAATQAVGASTQSVNNVATSHMDGFRVAQNGSSGVATGEATNSVGLWGQFFDGRASQGMRDSVSGYHGNFRGLLLGADTLVTDNVRAGGLFSAAKVSVASDGDNTGSSASVNNYGLTAYATYSGAPWYVNVLAGVARQQYSTVRAISYTGFSGVADGSFNGQQYSTSVQAGYPLNLDAWLPGATLTPIAGLSYSTLRQNSYTETGGNGAALTVNSSSTNSLKSELGAKLEKSFDTSYGKMLPSVQLGWRHEYKDGRTQSGASFSADSTGSTAFVTQSATPVANLAVLNLGVTLTQSKNLNLSAGYTLESGGGYTAQTGSVQVRWQY